jgi:hypothetical protein
VLFPAGQSLHKLSSLYLPAGQSTQVGLLLLYPVPAILHCNKHFDTLFGSVVSPEPSLQLFKHAVPGPERFPAGHASHKLERTDADAVADRDEIK